MRAVALSDKNVQKKITDNFIPLKIEIPYRTEKFPLDWPSLKMWRDTWVRMGGVETTGLTACSVVSPDLQTEYGSTGSAMVWELFDSIAYDAVKFGAMLDRAKNRAEEEKDIRDDPKLNEAEKEKKLAAFRKRVVKDVAKEGKFHLPPKGFTIEGATKLFESTGDIEWLEKQKKKQP
ncbi:hypothetical protein NT6N_18670 [Oceaniferula spumae]|uniref:Uncharacterized protein n=1 Tax=Oceaniferula spumae TaxID=2979115 RepID=A0AAT9FLL5_9BACT